MYKSLFAFGILSTIILVWAFLTFAHVDLAMDFSCTDVAPFVLLFLGACAFVGMILAFSKFGWKALIGYGASTAVLVFVASEKFVSVPPLTAYPLESLFAWTVLAMPLGNILNLIWIPFDRSVEPAPSFKRSPVPTPFGSMRP